MYNNSMLAKQILLSFLILILFPVLVGNTLFTLYKKEKNIVSYYLYGTITIFAFMQIVGVPLIFLKQPFHILYNATFVFILVFSLLGIVLRIIKKDFEFNKIKLSKKAIINTVCILVMICISIFFLYQTAIHQYSDADDSRFVVNAVDILETDKMFLTNPATGESIDWFNLNDSYKDVIAPWATYIALLSKFTGLSVVVMAHSIMSLNIYLLMICAWWLLSGKLFNDNKMYQSMFVSLCLLMMMYCNYSKVNYGGEIAQTVFTKTLTRPWQGKSVITSVGIPMMFCVFFEYYDKNNLKNMFIVLITDLALCFMSANGTVIGAVMIASFSLSYTISKRKISVGLLLMIPIVFNVMFYLISNIVK